MYFQIDSSVIPLMNDTDLKKYIPAYGDRLSVTSFCKRQLDEDSAKARGSSSTDKVIKRLRNKILARKRKHDVPQDEPQPQRKQTRKIHLGWKNYNFEDETYIQVRKVQGGAVRTPDVKRTDGKNELLALGAKLFFRGGVSKKGRLDDFDTDIEDFEGRDIGDSCIDDIYEELKVPRLYLYFCTKRKPNLEDVSLIKRTTF